MSNKRDATVVAAILALLGAVACSESGATGPATPPPPPPPADDIQRVEVTLTGVDVTGSCDHDSFFEDGADGEFAFRFEVTPSGSNTVELWRVGGGAFSEGMHELEGLGTVFNRNITAGEDFGTTFTATEFDGLLGADSDFDDRFRSNSHQYAGNGVWGPSGEDNTLTLAGKGDAELCGAILHYTITSAPAN
ncbi:MAG: hypothetical protein ACRELC_02635 [Gemmatimonadota bacterium]